MKRIIKHRLFNKFTVPGMLFLIVWGFVMYNAIGGTVGSLFSVMGADWASFRFGLPFFIYMAVSGAILIPVFGKMGSPDVLSVCMAVMAGVGEEVTFRGLPLSYAMRQWRDKGSKFIIIAVCISALAFGCVHLANLSVGASLALTLFQVTAATAMGVLLAAVFLRSGNLLVCMIIHTVSDIIAFCDVSQVDSGVLTASSLTAGNYIDLGLCIAMAIIGFWLIRPAKTDEIKEVWDCKWVKTI